VFFRVGSPLQISNRISALLNNEGIIKMNTVNQNTSSLPNSQISPPMCVQHALGFSKEIWEGELDLHTSYRYEQMWSGVFGAYDQCHHLNKQGKSAQTLTVAVATGMGKTQTVRYYAAKLNKEVGMLIVTQFIDEANSLANRINILSEENRAIAYHTKSDIYGRANELKYHQVVIVTHKMFTNAVDSHASSRQSINDLYAYGNDKRSVVVIDEAIDTIKSDELSYDQVHDLLFELKKYQDHVKTNIDDISLIEIEVALLEGLELSFIEGNELIGNKREVRCHIGSFIKLFNVNNYKLPMTTKLVKEGRISYALNNDKKPKKSLSEIVSSIDMLVNASWSYYSNKGQFHTARSAIPEDMSVVILDATSNVDRYYDIYPNVTKVPLPKNVRSYKNVDLYIAKDQVSGNQELCNSKKVKENAITICNHINSYAFEFTDSKVALFTFKELKQKIESIEDAEEISGLSTDVQTGHFGNLNGKNDYQKCNTLFVFGTPFKPSFCTINAHVLSTRDNTDCFNNTDEVREKRQLLKNSSISVELIQAINRISCRSVVDSDGNCQKCSIYLQLPVDKVLAGLIMKYIQKEMPGINVHDWHFDLIKSKKSGRKSTYENEFVAALKSIPVGESKLHVLLDNLPFKKGIKDKIKKRIADNDANDFIIKVMKGEQITCTKDKNKWIISKKNIY